MPNGCSGLFQMDIGGIVEAKEVSLPALEGGHLQAVAQSSKRVVSHMRVRVACITLKPAPQALMAGAASTSCGDGSALQLSAVKQMEAALQEQRRCQEQLSWDLTVSQGNRILSEYKVRALERTLKYG